MSRLGSLEIAPLTDADWERVDDLHERGIIDREHALGLLTAVASAPSLLPPSLWVPAMMADADDIEDVVLVLRLYNEVLLALEDGTVMAPDPDAADAAALHAQWARGYFGGVALDPEWPDPRQGTPLWDAIAPVLFLTGAAPRPERTDEGEWDELCRSARASLPDHVLRVHALLRPARKKQAGHASSGSRRGARLELDDAPIPLLRSLTEGGRIPVRALREFFASMRKLRPRAPWELFDLDEPIGLRAPELGVERGVVVVVGGENPGFCLFRSAEDALRSSRDEPVAVFLASYLAARELPGPIRAELKRFNLAPGGGPVPMVMRLDEEGHPVANEPADILLATGIAIALADLCERPVDEGPVEVAARAGSSSVRLTYPFELIEPADEPAPSRPAAQHHPPNRARTSRR